jgi:alkylation response protein AidB-like acyl-CoA dehydrogenase
MEQESGLKTLPGDEVRQIQWGFADRYDLQMLVANARRVARTVVAKNVAEGERNTHEWTKKKMAMIDAFDEAGLTAAFMDVEHGGFIEGPKNLALALMAFEISWVDGGAATAGLAGNLALSPINECGTPEQRAKYMGGAVPGKGGKLLRGSFDLTEPLPYAGVDGSMLSGTMRVEKWEEGKEPILKIEKRGRFITNMAYANFVTAAVGSADERIKGSTMVILEETDPGLYDRGVATKKMTHQLSSTHDPVFSLSIPASRIIGGYEIVDGKIVPNLDHGQIIEAVFSHTRVTVGIMTASKLLSAVEPLIRYHRQRYRGTAQDDINSPRFKLGIQQKEDAQQRLADIWAAGEAMTSLGFAAARLFDKIDALIKVRKEILAKKGITGGRALFKETRAIEAQALEFLKMEASLTEAQKASDAKYKGMKEDPLIQFALLDTLGNVYCPAPKLWNCGHGTNMMRQAVALMGGYGITEDAPGYLCNKWVDGQLEATYEGPEVVQRRQISLTMTNELFLEQLRLALLELEGVHKEMPNVGAAIVARAGKLFLYALDYMQKTADITGKKYFHANRQGVSFPLADALACLLGSVEQIRDVVRLKKDGHLNPVAAESLPGLIPFLGDLCVVQALDMAGEVEKVLTELIYGYMADPASARTTLKEYQEIRIALEESMAGQRSARDRAGHALTQVSIPEVLDYPQ